MTTASTAPPREVRAGDTVSWRRSLPQFPADAGWSLSVALISASAVITLAATADGADHLVSAAPSATAAWSAGILTVLESVTNVAGDRHTIAETRLRVLPNLAAGSGADTRSHAQRVLDNINAWLESKADFAGEVQLDGRRIRNYGLEELLRLRDRYAAIVAGELAGTGLVRRMKVQL